MGALLAEIRLGELAAGDRAEEALEPVGADEVGVVRRAESKEVEERHDVVVVHRSFRRSSSPEALEHGDEPLEEIIGFTASWEPTESFPDDVVHRTR